MYIKKGIALKAVAGLLVFVLTFTGFIDLRTLFNMNYYQNVKYSVNDPITTWVREKTDPKDVFLTTANVLDSVLLAGRPIYYGHPYYAWSAGYDTYKREDIVKRIYVCKDGVELKRILKESNISYVLVDDGMRNEAKELDEVLFSTVFKKVATIKQNNTNIYETK
jgi:glutaredoxin